MENTETIPTQEYIINNSDLDNGIMTLSSEEGISAHTGASEPTTTSTTKEPTKYCYLNITSSIVGPTFYLSYDLLFNGKTQNTTANGIASKNNKITIAEVTKGIDPNWSMIYNPYIQSGNISFSYYKVNSVKHSGNSLYIKDIAKIDDIMAYTDVDQKTVNIELIFAENSSSGGDSTPTPNPDSNPTPEPTTTTGYPTVNVVVQSEVNNERFSVDTYTGINSDNITNYENKTTVQFTSYYHNDIANRLDFIRFENGKQYGGLRILTNKASQTYTTIANADTKTIYTKDLNKLNLIDNKFYIRIIHPTSERNWISKTVTIK